ncbi:M64 family metallopeptidase [Actinosynnema sp. NPDC020468]|uniref:M64 family metallopeptidase n=1 Tax=Actinosynnema sp. NPDC020468 TaxID=3154488 RepID=UPI0033E86A65
MRAHRLTLPVLAIALVAVTAPVPGGAAAAPTEWREVFAPDGTITRVEVPRAVEASLAPDEVEAEVEVVQQTGPSDQRFDLVLVGDGYTEDDLDTYRAHVAGKWAELSAVEPFKSYKDKFNVWQVDVLSPESGVDNDPALGSAKDTALDMGFWCQGRDLNTERLLCVNQTAAEQYAALAPQADQIIALGNTTKYGGAGGGVATAAGGNAQAGQIAVHELGHSIGGLADEYDYPYEAYTGDEPGEPNVTKDPTGAKWRTYLGQPSPDGGTVGAFVGAKYYKTGLYRPTDNSIMRTLGREFNLVGRDAMIAAFKRKVPGL